METKVFLQVLLVVLTLVSAETACPNGFTTQNNSCYHIGDVKATWTQEAVFCAAYGSHLVIIETEQEQNFLDSLLNQRFSNTKTYFYTGLTDAVVEGTWVWFNKDTQLRYTRWAPGEPNERTIHAEQDCMILEQHGNAWLWDDGNCEVKERFICEREAEYDGGLLFG